MRNGSWLATLAVAVSLAVAATGCDSSGGGDIGPADPMPSGGISAGARNQPLAGDSVTQSSVGAEGVTTDAITVALSSTGDGQVRYRVANGEEWFLDSDDPETTTVINLGGQQRVSSGVIVTAVSSFKGQGQQIGSSTVRVNNGIGLTFFTDIESAGDSDYLV